MTTRVLKQNPHNYPDLKTVHVEPEHVKPTRVLRGAKYVGDDLIVRESRQAGGKNARRSLGKIPYGEGNPIHRGNSAFITYQNSEGKVTELDTRPIRVNESKDKSVSAAQRKEAIRFRVNVIKHKSGKYLHKEDMAVVKRIASLMIVDQVPQDQLVEHCPYKNQNYKDIWFTWSMLVSAMTFKTPSFN